MKRSELFEILYAQYEVERGRYNDLHARAQETLKITGIAAAIFGFFVGKEVLIDSMDCFETIIYSGGILFLVLSVLFAMVASSTKPYREIVDIKTIALDADKLSYDEEDLYSIMLANMIDCSTHNNKLMDNGFEWLKWCRYSMGLGILLVTTGIFMQVYA